jgi:hypothetical protein
MEQGMSRVVVIDGRGAIQLPNDLVAMMKPHTRFIIEAHGTALVLRPEAEQHGWASSSPEQRAEAVQRWASLERPLALVLADEARARDQIYD